MALIEVCLPMGKNLILTLRGPLTVGVTDTDVIAVHPSRIASAALPIHAAFVEDADRGE